MKLENEGILKKQETIYLDYQTLILIKGDTQRITKCEIQ